jgi:hypothetical protein
MLYHKQRYKKNKKIINDKANQYRKERRHRDPNFKLRISISSAVSKYISKNNGSKRGSSCMDYLSWTIEEFWQWIESQFSLSENLTNDGKVWMTKENRGRYNKKTWDDSNPSTWTWQLDHIIPQSDLPASSMEDENFKKCWALENLRPLSSKQNWLDGVNRTRHKK